MLRYDNRFLVQLETGRTCHSVRKCKDHLDRKIKSQVPNVYGQICTIYRTAAEKSEKRNTLRETTLTLSYTRTLS